MKLFNKIFLGAAAVAVTGAFSSCKEETTLSGADAVYITMANTDVTMLVGDTLRLSAKVTNASGKEIETPVTWSVGDESIVKIVDIVEYKKKKNPDYVAPAPDPQPGSPAEGEGEGEGEEAAASKADGGAVDTESEYLVTETHFVGVTPVPGAQGRTTTIKATLENGMFALTDVTVGRNTLAGSISITTECTDSLVHEDRNSVNKTSYVSSPNDAIWFDVKPIELIDDYDLSYDFEILEEVGRGDIVDDYNFKFPADPIEIDRKNGQVGIRFTAPRATGKAKFTLTLSRKDENTGEVVESESCSNTVIYCPPVSGGLEYLQGGKWVRPDYGPETPSNIKPKMSSVTIDINSTHAVGVCMGVESGRSDDIRLAMAAEQAGYYTWSCDGSAVVVEDQYFDLDYTSGFVTYFKVRSGIRAGVATVTYSTPGQDFVVNITVEDFNTVHPVEDILVESNGQALDLSKPFETYISRPMSLDISTVPDASFTYHIPEVTSSDPTILEVRERGADDGYTRQFVAHRAGQVTLTIKSLNVTKTLQVNVLDGISRLDWNAAALPSSIVPGTSSEIDVHVYMLSNPSVPVNSYNGTITWTSSDPSVATVTADPANSMKAVVAGLTEGEVQITASAEGYSATATIKVEALSGTTYTNDMADLSGIYFSSDEEFGNSLQIEFNDGHSDYFDLPFDTDYLNRTFNGTDGTITLGSAAPISGATYSITITDNGDGTVTYNGYFELNGARYIFDNLTATLM